MSRPWSVAQCLWLAVNGRRTLRCFPPDVVSLCTTPVICMFCVTSMSRVNIFCVVRFVSCARSLMRAASPRAGSCALMDFEEDRDDGSPPQTNEALASELSFQWQDTCF